MLEPRTCFVSGTSMTCRKIPPKNQIFLEFLWVDMSGVSQFPFSLHIANSSACLVSGASMTCHLICSASNF